MTVLDEVRNFLIARAPNPVCDDCIADRLNLSVRQHANHKTRELDKSLTFDRRVDTCALCGTVKKVIKYANRA